MNKKFLYVLISLACLLPSSTIFANPFEVDYDEAEIYFQDQLDEIDPYGIQTTAVFEEEESNETSFEIEKAKVKNVKITTDGSTISLKGSTSGFTDKMMISVKVISKSGNLVYMDVLEIKGNSFSTSFELDSNDEEDYMLKISGDLIYTKEFALSNTQTNQDKDNQLTIDKVDFDKINNFLKNELGDFIDYKGNLSFSYEYENTEDVFKIKMTGKNFTYNDQKWTEKTSSRWYSYLDIIADKVISFYNKDVQITVFDQTLSQIDYFHKSCETAQSMTASELERALNRDFSTYRDDETSFKISYKVADYSSNFKITASVSQSNFDKRNKNDFNTFLSNIFESYKDRTYKDFFFEFVDNSKKIFGKDFYNDKQGDNEIKIYEYYETLQDVISQQEKQPALDNDIVNMIQYGTNAIKGQSSDISINVYGEETQISLNNAYELSAKVPVNGVMVIPCNQTATSYRFTAPYELSSLLMQKKATLILSLPKAEVIIDFSKAVRETPIDIVIKENKNNSFGMIFELDSIKTSIPTGLSGVIRYDLNKTSSIQDIRTLNAFYINPTTKKEEIVKSEVKIDRQGIWFEYSSNGEYTLKDNVKYFNDTSSHWGNNTINILSSKEIVMGIGDGKYAPDEKITRAEFICMVVRNLGIDNGKNVQQNYFKDVKQADWFYSPVNIAKSMNLLPQTYETNLNPNQSITREEMIYITMACYEANPNLKKLEQSAIYYSDKDKISPWAAPSISKASEVKIARGYKNLIDPKGNATRAEAATVILKLITLSK